MMKVVIQIPCYNEASSLPAVLATLPRQLPGVTAIEWLVIDDGSTDATAAVARAHGVDHVVVLPRHRGLAKAFLAGLEASLRAGADIIVNTDADNQYKSEDIPKLIEPILRGNAELVIGARAIATSEHFSRVKKWLQRLGSWATRKISNTEVDDAPSGFRAMSRGTAMRMHVFNEYTYTVETIIQAGQKGLAVLSVPVGTNGPTRPSRLMRSLPGYVSRQVLTMVRVFMTYRPFRFFAIPGSALFGIGFLVGVRFLYLFGSGRGAGHVQSLILAALLMGLGFLLIVTGLVTDLIAVNRHLLESLDWRLQRLEEHAGAAPPKLHPREQRRERERA